MSESIPLMFEQVRIFAIADNQGLINWNCGAIDGFSASVLTSDTNPITKVYFGEIG
ncbi:MAG: hypothetical protein AAGE84_00785 [Cyanobacteria bacterium P01_G01_bin.39]